MFKRGHAPRGAPGRRRAGDLEGAADDLRHRLGLRRRPGRGRGRRGQCLVGRKAEAWRRRCRLRAPRPRHARRLRLVAAAEARPAGARQGLLRRRPGPAPEEPASTASPRTATAATTASGSASASPSPTTAPSRSSSRAASSSSPSPATASSSATTSTPTTGTAARRNDGIAPPGRYKLRVKLLGQDRVLVPPGAIKLHRAQRDPLKGCRVRRRPEQRVERLPRGARRARRRGAAAAGRSCCRPGRLRSAAMLAALVLFPALILGDQWHSHQIVDLRDDTTRFAALASLALVSVGSAGRRLPPLADPAAAGDRRGAPVPGPPPCRRRHGEPAGPAVPRDRGRSPRRGDLGEWQEVRGVDLGAGVVEDGRGPRSPSRPREQQDAAPRSTPLRLAAIRSWPRFVVLYALQTLYSPDFSKGLQNVCFFFVPFSLVFALLRDVEWDRRLLVLVLWVVGLEAVAFVADRDGRVR